MPHGAAINKYGCKNIENVDDIFRRALAGLVS